MDQGRVGFDSGGVRRGGAPQMLLFGGGGSANSNGFIRGEWTGHVQIWIGLRPSNF
jgi:hypothetical protein